MHFKNSIMTTAKLSANWILTIPKGAPGKPQEIKGSELDNLNNEFFKHTDNGFEFYCPCNGVTTPNSHYPRCELREIIDGKEAAWEFEKGTHTMTYEVSCDHLPKNKPQICIGQVHNAKDDVFEVRFETDKINVTHNSTSYGTLGSFELGKSVVIVIIIDKGIVKITLKDKTISFKPKGGKGCYFKLGDYVQSNKDHGDELDFGKVTLKSVVVKHTK